MKRWHIILATVLLGGAALRLEAQQPPAQTVLSVSITSPADESSETYGAPFTFTAAAQGNSSTTITTMTVNGTVVASAAAVPPSNAAVAASATFYPPQPGVYNLAATASDGTNAVTSAPVQYFVTGTMITTPLQGAYVPLGSSVVINATSQVAPDEVTTSRVDFYDTSLPYNPSLPVSPTNTQLLGSSYHYPYSYIYTPAGPAGTTHTFVAVGYDPDGNSYASYPPTSITMVTPVGPPPTCTITTPLNGVSIEIPNYAANASASIPINVSAIAPGVSPGTITPSGYITQVQLYIDGVLFGTSTTYPYTFSWSPQAVAQYSLVALAYDDKNNVIASTPATVVPIGAGPVVSIGAPNGTISAGVVTPISVTASGSNKDPITGQLYGIASVEFFQDNGVGVPLSQPDPVNQPNLWVGSFKPVQSFNPTTFLLQNSVLTAIATENVTGFQGTSPSVTVAVNAGGTGGGTTTGTPPTVSVTSPAASAQLPVNAPVVLGVAAAAPNGNVVSIQYTINGASIGTETAYPYHATWTPTSLGTYQIVAQVTDNLGDAVNSAPVTVSVVTTPGPVVSVTSPAASTTATVGIPVSLAANAGSVDGTVSNVEFFVNGTLVGTASSAPYSVSWTPTVSSTYTIVAEATDNQGNITTSSPVTLQVGTNLPPLVSITSPTTGTVGSLNSALTVTAAASDPDGTVSQVQFFANGVAIAGGTITASPYTITWTPASAGVYTLTAVATDNSGAVTTSSPVIINIVSAASAGTTVYTGTYQGTTANGRFAFVSVDGQYGTFIGHPSSGNGAPIFAQDLILGSSGSFSGSGLTGITSATGVSGSFSGGATLFIGPVVQSNGSTVPAGYYAGSISGQSGSQFFAIVGADGSIMAYVSEGSFADAGDGTVDSSGAFSIATPSGNTLAGTIAPATGFLTATLSGGPGGTVLAALSSGGTFSDGVMKNLSTRGQVGTGGNILIAGFVIGGTADKHILVRAVGPTLSEFGLTGVLPASAVSLFNSSGAVIASNQGWSNGNASAALMSSAGAFALPAGSGDSALVATLAPGAYSAQVSGVGGATGLGLVELYDLDSLAPFSPQKLVNVSTRGVVGTGSNLLIGGLVINGTAPKRLLIRAVGPTLSQFGVTGSLSSPVLGLYDSAGVLVRQNMGWQTGNDPALVASANSQSGAFSLPSGSADAVLLVVVPPGSYSAQVSGDGSATGVALVEVYEVP